MIGWQECPVEELNEEVVDERGELEAVQMGSWTSEKE